MAAGGVEAVEPELAQQVRSGAVAYDLLRPVGLYGYWLARCVAFRTARTSLRAVPLVLLAGVVLPLLGASSWALQPPANVTQGLLFGGSLLGLVLLSSSITALMHISLLYFLSAQGVNSLVAALIIVLSGMIVPLPLFPDFMQGFLQAQPFAGLADVPFRIYSGHIPAADALHQIGRQLAWSSLFVVVGWLGLEHATRRIVVQGG